MKVDAFTMFDCLYFTPMLVYSSLYVRLRIEYEKIKDKNSEITEEEQRLLWKAFLIII